MDVKKGAQLRITLEKFADRGKSLARLNGLVVFVRGGVPGDEVDVTIRRLKKSYAEAEVTRIIRPSPLRQPARCRYFGSCGGCKWQHVDYEAQLSAKRQSVEEALKHAGGFDGVDVPDVIPSRLQFNYRNKMEFSFSAHRWLTKSEIASGDRFDKSFALGLHAPGQFAKVLDIQECHLQSAQSVAIVNAIRGLSQTHSWKPWDTRSQRGLLRHLVIREGRRTNQRMVNLVTSRQDAEVIGAVAELLQADEFEVDTFVHTVNDTPAQTAAGSQLTTVFGPGVIYEKIEGYEFRVAPQSFFQTNTEQAERLYQITRSLAELREDDLVYDLYCGAGSIAITLAPLVRQVIGVEVVESAVEDARFNAKLNKIENCQFFAGDLARTFNDAFIQSHGRPDTLIVDPPRAGLHPKVVKRIAAVRPARLVYVSCNPQTQSRDLKELSNTYRLDAVQPIDLFPHTDHIENVARLSMLAD